MLFFKKRKTAQSCYEMGYACYLKYGKDSVSGGRQEDPHDLDLAEFHLKKALELNHLWVPAMVILGFVYQAKGDTENAKRWLGRALQYPTVLGSNLEGVRESFNDLCNRADS